MRRRTGLVAAGIIMGVLSVFGALGVWKTVELRKAAAAPPPPEPAEAVQIVTPQSVQWTPTSDLVGTVIAIQSVTLSNEVAGQVKEVMFESGAVVNPGQVLLTLDDSTEQADLNAALAAVAVSEAGVRSAQANLRTAQAQLELARANMRRWEPAVAARAAAESELDRVKTELDRATADIDSFQAAIERAAAQVLADKARADQIRTQIAKKTLKAPFKARAGLRNIHPGQYLAEGATVVSLQSIDDKIYVDFAVPQEHAVRVSAGMKVIAASSALGTDAAQIEVIAMDAAANPTTRNLRVRAIVDNPAERLRPGMFVDVRVPVAETRALMTIPSTAVRRASFGDHVFVITQDPAGGPLRAHQRFITLGPTLADTVVVASGLQPGEEIAADGAHKLRDKAAVLRGAPPQAKAKAAG